MLRVGDKAPDFELTDDQGQPFVLRQQQGKRLLLVFYPGDNTPVCTRQLCDYRDGVDAFSGLGVEVVGISSDSTDSHSTFKSRHQLPFRLLTDSNLEVARKYDSKGLIGMKRSVFLLDESGVIRYVHVESLALFRRRREELLGVIRDLDDGRGD